jgi:cysteine desulfurase
LHRTIRADFVENPTNPSATLGEILIYNSKPYEHSLHWYGPCLVLGNPAKPTARGERPGFLLKANPEKPMSMKLPIYLDYSATTPVDPRVAEKMIPFLTEEFGNPASRSHSFGWTAEKAVEDARAEVAKLVNADPKEIVWTSGATESDNLAIKGAAYFYQTKGRHLITVKTEHKAVLDTMRELEAQGFEVTYLDPMPNGLLDLDAFRAAIRPDTIVASVMHVNNEIGVIQDIAAIGAICREKGVIFHVDAAQSTGKVEIDLAKLPVDLMSFSAHKTYGPKGIGALYVRRQPRVRLKAMMHGGGHERGLRSGTLATHQIVGMGEAFRLAREDMAEETKRIGCLRDKLLAAVKNIEEVYINGDLEQRIPHNLNISFNYVEGESLMMALKDLAVSSGSACTSASLEPSYVLRALGRSDELAHSSIRFTLGRYTTEEEVDFAISLIKEKVDRLRDLSPLWEMYKEGIDLNSVQWAAAH